VCENKERIPHIPLPLKQVMADVLKVRPPDKASGKKANNRKRKGIG
jgi:hypothetical protein